ncbi:hypothetical protein [Amycolatopsis pigmentata]|uniref:Uncharacterized protein n=1 Tax=Amycolatopsis pigmentata TaxID=450801 RepID=A0ABW5FYE2_9PSEU
MTTIRDEMPETRALLGVDVIDSASNEGYRLNALWVALDRMMHTALTDNGIPPGEVLNSEPGGDGGLYTLPGHRLGAMLDLTTRLDELAATHNRFHKPEIKLRIAIELGAVGDETGYYAPKIRLNRLLNAGAFKALMERCLRERPDGSVNSGLIISRSAFHEAFGGAYTATVHRHEFVEIEAAEKKFKEMAWVRVPGLDSRTLAEFASARAEATRARAETGKVVNQVFGAMNGVQAGDVHGDINFGTGPR